MIQIIVSLVLVALAIPVAYLIAWMASDELIVGRRWFSTLVWVFALVAVISTFYGNYVFMFSSVFVVILAFVSQIKSHDRRWTSRRI